MKRTITIIMACMCLTMAQAKVVLNESFNREVGQLSKGSMQDDMGSDLADWWTTTTYANYIQVVDANLTYTGYQSTEAGKAIRFAGSANRDVRAFNYIQSVAGNSVYYSLLLNVESLKNTTKDYLISLLPDQNNLNASYQFAQLKIAGNEGLTSFRLGVTKSNEGLYDLCEQNLERNKTYLIVVRYDFVAGDNNDVVSLWINPTKLSINSPSFVCAQEKLNGNGDNKGAASMKDAGYFGMVYLHPSSNTPTMTIDELRIATDWNDLFEAGSSQPDPAISVPASVDFGEVTIGVKAEQKITIMAENLTNDLTVTHTNSELTLGTSSIAKELAMKGYQLSLTLANPQTLGAQSDVVTVASGSLSKPIAVTWTTVKAPDPDPEPDPEPLPPTDPHLLQNAGFEEFSTSNLNGLKTASYEYWSFSGGAWALTTEETDVKEGMNALKTTSEFKNNGTLYQSLDVTGFNTGDEFELRINYKILTPQGDNTISLASYWASSTDGELTDDADKLKVALANSSDWKQVTIRTKKPEKATKFEFTLTVAAKAIILLDDFAFDYIEPTNYFKVTPEKVNSVETMINKEVTVAILTIRQKGLTQPVNLGLGGTDKAMFKLSKTTVTAASEDVKITYAPTEGGHHSATLSIYDDESPEISLFNRTIALSGFAVDPSKTPMITISPIILPEFNCAAKEEVSQTLTVKSVNCTDFVYATIQNTQGNAFLIDGSMLPKNTETKTVITFKPMEAGDYAATITWKTEGGLPVSFNVSGKATAAAPEEIDYATTFVWNENNPLDVLDEGFNNAADYRNKTLKLTGWQNVVTKGSRAWWGYTTDSSSVAKVTSYMYNVSTETDAEMWLVTPALNFKTANPKQFGFRILGEIIFEGQQGGVELYYVDATKEPVLFEHITAVDELIPAGNAELSGQFVPVVADLTGQPLADVFHFAFRFYDKAGSNGVTYHLDNVTWGKQVLAVEQITAPASDTKLILKDGQIYILRADVIYTLDGRRVQ